MRARLLHLAIVIAACAAAGAWSERAIGAQTPPAAERRAPASPEDLVRKAIAAKLGPGADITVTLAGLPADSGPFRDVRVDPNARLGKPMMVSFVPEIGRAVVATATVKVVADHVVTTRAIDRGHAVGAEDAVAVRAEVRDAPLRPLPVFEQVNGTRALRPISAGVIVLPGYVLIRRAIEPGDPVTAIFATGEIEISATLVAADGGRVGDVIRVVNPQTKRYLKGRVLDNKKVEVIHVR